MTYVNFFTSKKFETNWLWCNSTEHLLQKPVQLREVEKKKDDF